MIWRRQAPVAKEKLISVWAAVPVQLAGAGSSEGLLEGMFTACCDTYVPLNDSRQLQGPKDEKCLSTGSSHFGLQVDRGATTAAGDDRKLKRSRTDADTQLHSDMRGARCILTSQRGVGTLSAKDIVQFTTASP